MQNKIKFIIISGKIYHTCRFILNEDTIKFSTFTITKNIIIFTFSPKYKFL